MDKRSFFVGATAAGLAALASPAAAATIAITELSVSPSQPNSGADKLGALKGTLSFRVIANPKLAGNQYKGLESWGNGDGSGQFQCVELIKRYAQKLEFKGYGAGVASKNLPSVGDGQDAARRFADNSSGTFVYTRKSGSRLPRLGAVLSIDGGTVIPGGHVGIVQMVSTSSSGSRATVTLFDQNFPSSRWKTVDFTKSNGKWSGTMSNTKNGKTTYLNVVGWSDPTG